MATMGNRGSRPEAVGPRRGPNCVETVIRLGPVSLRRTSTGILMQQRSADFHFAFVPSPLTRRRKLYGGSPGSLTALGGGPESFPRSEGDQSRNFLYVSCDIPIVFAACLAVPSI